MRSGVVNHDIVYDTQTKTDNLNKGNFVGELINYVIL